MLATTLLGLRGLVVGATTLADERAYFSNHGKCVDVFAPGLNILSTGPFRKRATLSGTGQAAAHMAGLVAYYISLADKGDSSPDTIKQQIRESATNDVLSDLPDDTINVSHAPITSLHQPDESIF